MKIAINTKTQIDTEMKIKFLAFFILFFCTVFGQTNIEELEDKAEKLYRDNQYKASIEVYNLLLKEKNNNSYYLSQKGICYFNLNDFENAKENIRLSILYEDPNNKATLAKSYSNLSACFSNLDNDEKAYEYALKAYYMDESSLSLWNAASLGFNVGQYQKGLDMLNKTTLNKHNDFEALYGRAYLNLLNPDKSIEAYQHFFSNLDEKDRFAKTIVMLNEKYNLWLAYIYSLSNYIATNNTKYPYYEQLTTLTKELTSTEKNEFMSKRIIELLNNNKQYDNPYKNLLITQFELLPEPTVSERANFYYRVNNYKKSEEAIAEYINETSDYAGYDRSILTLYLYLNELNIAIEKSRKTYTKINDKDLEKALLYLKEHYEFAEDNKKYNENNKNYLNDMYNPVLESILVLKPYQNKNKEEAIFILSKIVNTIPNQEIKKKMTQLIKQ